MRKELTGNDHFSRQAEGYSQYRPAYPQELIDFLLDHVVGQETLWDAGTGNGQLARQLAPGFTQVYATDHSAQQLRFAQGPKHVAFIHCSSENTTLADSSVDLVTIAQAIHWFDLPAFYREVRRVAKPNAKIAALGYGSLQIAGLEEVLLAFHRKTFGEFLSMERQHVDEHYRNLDFPFAEVPSPEFSQSFEWGMDLLEGYFNTWSSVQKYIQKYGVNPVDSLMVEITEILQEAPKVGVTFPYFIRLGTINA